MVVCGDTFGTTQHGLSVLLTQNLILGTPTGAGPLQNPMQSLDGLYGIAVQYRPVRTTRFIFRETQRTWARNPENIGDRVSRFAGFRRSDVCRSDAGETVRPTGSLSDE
jgi:hypothetical protein